MKVYSNTWVKQAYLFSISLVFRYLSRIQLTVPIFFIIAMIAMVYSVFYSDISGPIMVPIIFLAVMVDQSAVTWSGGEPPYFLVFMVTFVVSLLIDMTRYVFKITRTVHRSTTFKIYLVCMTIFLVIASLTQGLGGDLGMLETLVIGGALLLGTIPFMGLSILFSVLAEKCMDVTRSQRDTVVN